MNENEQVRHNGSHLKESVCPDGQINIAHSSATRRPVMTTPESACDSHLHIYDSDYRSCATVPPQADVASYRQLQSLLGTGRAVIVQPRVYGTDNTVTLRAIQTLGIQNTRGIAVVSPDVDEHTLQEMQDGGIRGVRFSFYLPNSAAGDFDSVLKVAHRIAPLGWHLQLHWTAEQIVAQESLLMRLPTPMVFDHMGRLPPFQSRHRAFKVLERLLKEGKAWVKLSAAYLNTDQSSCNDYSDTIETANWLSELAPDRLVWGSDWPHVTETGHKPDDARLFDLLGQWCAGNESVRHRILVENPQALYGF